MVCLPVDGLSVSLSVVETQGSGGHGDVLGGHSCLHAGEVSFHLLFLTAQQGAGNLPDLGGFLCLHRSFQFVLKMVLERLGGSVG